MSWHAPNTYAEMAASISQGWGWQSRRHGLRGESIQVLSARCRADLDLDATHELSRAVVESAQRRADRYLTDGTRTPEDGEAVYFVADLDGRVLTAVTAGGGIRLEVGSNRVQQRDDLREALNRLATRVRDISDW